MDRWELVDDAKFISEDGRYSVDERVIRNVGDVLYHKGGTIGVARGASTRTLRDPCLVQCRIAACSSLDA